MIFISFLNLTFCSCIVFLTSLICLSVLWYSLSFFKQLIWILCQTVHWSPFLWGDLLENYCVPFWNTFSLIFCVPWSLAVLSLHWRSCHLPQSLLTGLGKKQPSPICLVREYEAFVEFFYAHTHFTLFVEVHRILEVPMGQLGEPQIRHP